MLIEFWVMVELHEMGLLESYLNYMYYYVLLGLWIKLEVRIVIEL